MKRITCEEMYLISVTISRFTFGFSLQHDELSMLAYLNQMDWKNHIWGKVINCNGFNHHLSLYIAFSLLHDEWWIVACQNRFMKRITSEEMYLMSITSCHFTFGFSPPEDELSLMVYLNHIDRKNHIWGKVINWMASITICHSTSPYHRCMLSGE